MRKVEQIFAPDQRQTLHSQADDLCSAVVVDAADAFQPHLRDLLIAGVGAACAVDAFIVIDFFHHTVVGIILDDGERDVGLERHEPSAEIGKGDDVAADKKALVFCIQVVFFKFAHTVRPVAVALVQRAQAEHRLFFIAQNIVHCCLAFSALYQSFMRESTVRYPPAPKLQQRLTRVIVAELAPVIVEISAYF